MKNLNEILKEEILKAEKAGVSSFGVLKSVSFKRMTEKGKVTKDSDGYRIELNSELMNSESSLREVLMHELIHTCDGCTNHGILFRENANKVNEYYGYNISKYQGVGLKWGLFSVLLIVGCVVFVIEKLV